MKYEGLTEKFEEHKNEIEPKTLEFYYKNLSPEDAGEILKQGCILDVFYEPLSGKFSLKPNAKKEDIEKFQRFLNQNFDSIEKRAFAKFECLNCGTIITEENKPRKCSCGSEKFKKISQDVEEIKFNYESISPEKNISELNDLKEIIIEDFPSIWFETKACLSTYATLSLKNLNGCPSLNLIGNPAGEKTTALSFFYGQDLAYLSDDFTPKSFVSHASNVKQEDLEKVDLLPKIKNKVLISPELAPLFETPRDKIVENFAMLTRVLDGEGLNRDGGVHGHRGYSGDYKFAWLGASTPIRASVWNVMGKIGNRLFFLNMREKNRTDKDFLDMFTQKAYEEKIKKCRGAVRNFLDNHFKKNPVRSVEWDAEGDIFVLQEIIKYAKFLAKLRGSLMVWKSEEQGKYEFSFPIIEEPPRAINALYNFAKGHALINGRNFLKKEDLEIVKAICFSSMPHDRVKFLKLLTKHEGKLTTSQIEKELGCSDETARKTMSIFEILGVVDVKKIQVESSDGGRPMHYIEIKEEFAELLEHTQGSNDLENSKPSENRGVREGYDDLKPEDFVKKQGERAHTQGSNDLEKSFPSESNPVRAGENGNAEQEESLK